MRGDMSSTTATCRALEAVYRTEATAFRPEVIKAAARDRGVWPFDAERIRALAALNHGGLVASDDKSFESAVVSKAVSSAQVLMSRKSDEISAVRVTPKKNEVYSVKELHKLAFEEDLDAAIAAEDSRIEAEEKQAAAEKDAAERVRKHQRDSDEREDRAQKKAKKSIDDV